MADINYLAVVERGLNDSFGVWFPDLPGCVTAGHTLEEVVANAREAVALHVEGMREEGLPLPESRPQHFHPADYPESLVHSLMLFAVSEEDTVGRVPNAAKRINISLPTRLIDRIDAAAEAKGLTRSGLLALAAKQWMSANRGEVSDAW